MSLSSCQMPRPHQSGFGCLLLVCFLVGFFTYYKSEIKFPDFSDYLKRGNHSCVCPVEAQTQGSNPNRSSEQQVEAPTDGPQQIQGRGGGRWAWKLFSWFGCGHGAKNWISPAIRSNIKDAAWQMTSLFTRKPTGLSSTTQTFMENLENLPSEPRPWFQKWIWMNWEPPTFIPKLPGLDNLINLTCCYRSDSHIPAPYGYVLPQTSEVESFQLPTKDKLVCWIVSHWNDELKRVQYYNELKEHIQVDLYGKAFDKKVDKQNYGNIVSSCKFYLSFENSQHTDYITEKLFNPLAMGTVPVVLGTSRENYENLVPGDSFIHVDDFSTPKELAERAPSTRPEYDWIHEILWLEKEV